MIVLGVGLATLRVVFRLCLHLAWWDVYGSVSGVWCGVWHSCECICIVLKCLKVLDACNALLGRLKNTEVIPV